MSTMSAHYYPPSLLFIENIGENSLTIPCKPEAELLPGSQIDSDVSEFLIPPGELKVIEGWRIEDLRALNEQDVFLSVSLVNTAKSTGPNPQLIQPTHDLPGHVLSCFVSSPYTVGLLAKPICNSWLVVSTLVWVFLPMQFDAEIVASGSISCDKVELDFHWPLPETKATSIAGTVNFNKREDAFHAVPYNLETRKFEIDGCRSRDTLVQPGDIVQELGHYNKAIYYLLGVLLGNIDK